MPRFFTYFHAPYFWGGIAALLWIFSWIFLPFPSHAKGTEGLLIIVGVIFVWSKWHYRMVSVPDCKIPERPGETPLGHLANQRNFFIGTVGFSYRLTELDSVLGTHFNSFTPGFETKWNALLANKTLGQYDFTFADRLVDHALSHGVRVRGHTLVWGKFDLPVNLTETVESSSDPTNTLKEILFHHITTVVEHFGDRIFEWDVVNEPLDYRSARLDHSIFFRHLGEEYIDFAFDCARKAAPTCRLFLNEQLWNYRNSRARSFLALIDRLSARHAAIDGIGLQSHVNVPPIPQPQDLGNYLRQIAERGYDIEITEFDAVLRLFCSHPDPYQAQGDYFCEMLATCLEVPRCRGLTVWGLTDADNWYSKTPHYRRFGPHAPFLFDAAMKAKPAYWGFHRALTAPLPTSKTRV